MKRSARAPLLTEKEIEQMSSTEMKRVEPRADGRVLTVYLTLSASS